MAYADKFPVSMKKGGKSKIVMSAIMKKGGSSKKFPDLNKDGKITKADILAGRGIIPAKGKTKKKK